MAKRRTAWQRLRTGRTVLARAGVGLAVLVAVLATAYLVVATGRLLLREIGAALDATAAGKRPDYAALRNLALVVGAAVGAPFVVWRSWIAHRQAAIADSAAITNRFTQAVAQLGAEKTAKRPVRDPKTGKTLEDARGVPIVEEVTEPNLEVRIGGLYALERIAQDSARDHVPIMETLCAYIRQNAPAHKPAVGARTRAAAPTGQGAADDGAAEGGAGDGRPAAEAGDAADGPPEPTGPPRLDVQTALTILGRRSAARFAYETRRTPPYRLDLHGTDLRRAKLGGANLGRADLGGANLVRANLAGANLGGADLGGADLRRSEASSANIQGALLASADCTESTLTLAQFASTFGDGGTKLPEGVDRPPHWRKTKLDFPDAHAAWMEWKSDGPGA